MTFQKSSSVFTLALLLTLAGATPAALSAPAPVRLPIAPLLGQASPTFPLVDSIASGTNLRINGSSSMAVVNQALKQQFEAKYPGTTVEAIYSDADQGVKAVLDGSADVAAIGRSLSDAEKGQGLTAVPVSVNKIAILVGNGNTFNGSLTTAQFARIFRGEITDWAEVGGEPGPIRFIDRPVSSDTRAAFSRYPVFQSAPFESGTSAVTVTEDSTEAVVKELGEDGISYAIANQADQPGARIVPMHKVLPDDARYPFSQPLAYVYKDSPSPAVAGLLGVATNPLGQEAIATAQAAAGTAAAAAADGAAAAGTAAANPATTAAAPGATGTVAAMPPGDAAGLPPWLGWLLLLPLLGLLLGWWFKRKRPAEDLPPLSPNATEAELPPASTEAPNELATRAGSVISADRVAINGVNHPQPPAPVVEPEPIAVSEPIAPPNPIAEIEPIPEPEPIEPPQPTGLDAGAIAGGLAAAGAAAIGWSALQEQEERRAAADEPDEPAEPVAEPVEPVAEASSPNAQASSLDAEAITPDAEAITPVAEAPAPIAEANTPVTEPVSNPWDEPAPPETGAIPGAAFAGAAIAGVGLSQVMSAQATPSPEQDEAQLVAETARYNVGQTDLSSESLASVDEGLDDLPDGYGDSTIVLIPRDPHWAYAYWDVPNAHREAVRQQGGTRLALRLYDVTDVDLASPQPQKPHSVQQFECEEFARDWYLPVPVSDRDYVAEIGYIANDGDWLVLARSLPIRIPPVYPSDWVDDQDITIPWDENLKGKQFLELVPPNLRRTSQTQTYAFSLAQAAEMQRLAGSVFGSAQQTPESVSSFAVTQSGVGMSGVGMSGVGMSGAGLASLNLSGIGMSGIGMSGIGMAGFNLAGMNMSGVGMSGIGMLGGLNMSGVGMSGIGMFPGFNVAGMNMSGLNMSGVGMSGLTMSGIGMSGIGMSGIGMSGLTMSGIGMSGIGMSGIGMSGIGMMMSGSGIGFSASAPPIRPRQFWLVADAELIVYGATEPNATLTIGGQPVPLNEDGTFRIQLSFQDGDIDFPIMAVAADGEQNRSIHLTFNRQTPHRHTNTKDEAQDEWGPETWGI
jgi:ABC-type phosphate transport system substrate-binding protein